VSERYRTEYDGEFVIINNTIKDGKKVQEREWIDNPIENQHISGCAVVIGNGESRYSTNFNGKFDLKNNIEKHAGWHLGRKRLQSYGTEGCWKEMQCDFYIEYDKENLAEISEQKYSEKATVYSNARNCISNPGEFYLVPYGQRGTSVSVAAWLACFDGHKEVYLVGVDGTNDDQGTNQKKINELATIMITYPSVQFIHVSDGKLAPDEWRQNRNFIQWTYHQFVSHCDI
jgi:hypothetical protein